MRVPVNKLHRIVLPASMFFSVVSLVSGIVVSFQPPAPTAQDIIQIQIAGCTNGGVFHWGVDARGNSWKQAIPAYRPTGSKEDGIATRTPLAGPDSQGVCRVTLGPFNDTNQPVGTVDFAIQWNDGSWDTSGGNDYHVPVSLGRISIAPTNPAVNDAITVTVHRAAPGGQLRWGVNSKFGMWRPPATNYWPSGTVPSDDGLAVDSPLSPPDSSGDASIVLGPFNSPHQLVRSLHTAVHWSNTWDTDLGRNYNIAISTEPRPADPDVSFASPTNGQAFKNMPRVSLDLLRTHSATLWLDGKPLVSLITPPFELSIDTNGLALGSHTLLAFSAVSNRVGMAEVSFWRAPEYAEKAAPSNLQFGATDNGDGTCTFALYAPRKHFVSLIGDFNEWNPLADVMNESPDGTWWLSRRVGPGVHQYQYSIDGELRLADPYSTAVDWKDDAGRETHLPEKAKSILAVGRPPFKWNDQPFKRPSISELVIYEFYIPDLCPAQGFTGVVARLDYIKDLGVTAIEPLPVTQFPGDRSWGYNPAFHMAAESTYGTPDELKRLVDEAHRRGLAVVFDMVLNHMEWNSPLFKLYGLDYASSPYFHEFFGENWGFPDIDQPSPAVKRYEADLLKFWLVDYHADGFRYDATRWVGWQGYNDWGASWLAYAAKQVDPKSYQIAEHLPADPDLVNRTPMDSDWHDYFRWRLRDMIKSAKFDRHEFERIMTPRMIGFSNDFGRVAYIESHDEERLLRELKEAGLSEDEALRRDLSAMAVTLTAPGVVMLYAGEEFGEATPKVVGLNPLHWEKLDQPSYRLLHDNVRALVRLRTENPALKNGDLQVQGSGLPPDVAVYQRRSGESGVVVAVNFGRAEQTVNIVLPLNREWINVLNPGQRFSAGTPAAIPLPPGGCAVLATPSM